MSIVRAAASRLYGGSQQMHDRILHALRPTNECVRNYEQEVLRAATLMLRGRRGLADSRPAKACPPVGHCTLAQPGPRCTRGVRR